MRCCFPYEFQEGVCKLAADAAPVGKRRQTVNVG
jgi:hypothetical protein